MSDDVTTPQADNDDLKTAVAGLVDSIKGSTDSIRKAATDAANATPPPTPAQPAPEPMTEESLNKLADDKGVGAVIKEVGEKVLGPMHAHNLKLAADRERRFIEKDADVGKWARENRKVIDAKIKSDGITDQYIAEHGYEKIVEQLRLEDPDVRNADVEARAQVLLDAKIKELQEKGELPTSDATNTPASAATVAAYPVDRPGVAPTASPKPKAKTEEQAIAAVKIPAEELEFGRRYFHMSPADMQKQRYERQQLEAKYGEMGLKAMGGYPVCSLASLGIPDPEGGF
jgi:hypothetical protein